LLQFSRAISSPSGAVSTLIELFSFAAPALAEAESEKFASVVCGAAAFNTCLPKPNLPVKRTC